MTNAALRYICTSVFATKGNYAHPSISFTPDSNPSVLCYALGGFTLGSNSMSDSNAKREMLETLRSDWGRLRHQRAKLEKIQKMRQSLERLGLAGKYPELEEYNASQS